MCQGMAAALLLLAATLPTTAGCRQNAKPKAAVGTAKAKQTATRDPRKDLVLIDSHVHLTPLPGPMRLALRMFAELNIEKFAVKSAGNPGTPRYAATLRWANRLGERMAFFTNVDWDGIDEPGWAKREADKVERAMKDGASGIKIFKALGLGVRLKDGKLLKVDDPRLDPIFERCAQTGAIVAWHVADPVAFFEKPDKNNERYAELSLAPDWSFYGKDYPSHAALLAARDRVIAKHPKTTFLGIHLANHPEKVSYVAKILDRFPNLYVDIAARLPEIGRHPVPTLKRFFTRYRRRVLFGTDLIITPRGMQLGSVAKGGPPTYKDAITFYKIHRRFFETADRDFDHPTPIQGEWKINAVDLPLAVLKQIYYENADKLIFAKRRAYLAKRRAAAKAASGASKPAGGAKATPSKPTTAAPSKAPKAKKAKKAKEGK
jgi:predicted TIM-barrel fold metal-dependent hydrolase